MGYEYTIECAAKDDAAVREALETLPFFSHIERPGEREPFYIYRRPENDGQLPNALIEIMPASIYFCDYGEGLDILKELVFQLALLGISIRLVDHND